MSKSKTKYSRWKSYLRNTGLAVFGAFAGATGASAVTYEEAQADGSIVAYTNFILGADLKDGTTRTNVEKAFCDIYAVDPDAALSLASGLVGVDLAGKFEVEKIALRECATTGVASLYVV